MIDKINDALLPEGLRDELPPLAAKEARLVMALEQAFESYGYLKVKPPMVEFEETLLAGAGSGLAAKTFRVMDPLSQRMMAIRADMTPQIARIARTRLANQPRPLRLSYTGQVLRVKGDGLRPERQFAQAGLELIGSSSSMADLEVLCAAVEALQSTGLTNLSVDLTSPNLVPTVCAQFHMDQDAVQIARRVADGKDVSLLPQDWPQELRDVLTALIQCTGPIDQALSKLDAVPLAGEAGTIREDLKTLAHKFQAVFPDVGLTLDPGEYQGFEYQTGLGFTLFARGVRGELGRGGRYKVQGTEPAVGVSMYLDTVLRALPSFEGRPRILIAADTDFETQRALRADGYAVVWALEDTDLTPEQARTFGCGYIWQDGTSVPLAG